MVLNNAHKYGKWAGICGELGTDLKLTEEFVRMGVDELSVAPSMVLKVRKRSDYYCLQIIIYIQSLVMIQPILWSRWSKMPLQ